MRPSRAARRAASRRDGRTAGRPGSGSGPRGPDGTPPSGSVSWPSVRRGRPPLPTSSARTPDHQGAVETGDPALGQLGHQRSVRVGRPGHHHQAGRTPVQPVHDARTHRVGARPSGQVAELRIAGQQPVDQGPARVPGPGVDHQPGRLVHHDQLGVLVDHVESHRRVRAGPGLAGGTWFDPEALTAAEHDPAAGHRSAVHLHGTLLDQSVHGRSGQVGDERHRLVDPHPVEAGRDDDGEGGHGRWGDRSSDSTNSAQPITMAASARLKVGQTWSATKSTTAPWSPRNRRSARFPSAPAEDQAEGDGPPGGRRPPDERGEDAGEHEGDRDEDEPLPLEQAERGARVPGELEIEGADDVDRPRRRDGSPPTTW